MMCSRCSSNSKIKPKTTDSLKRIGNRCESAEEFSLEYMIEVNDYFSISRVQGNKRESD